MSKQQKLKFTIRQDGYVTEEVLGAVSNECVNITRAIEEKLGSVESRDLKPEYYSNNVTLQQNKNENQAQT